jgi:hypothetical protein
MDVRTHPISFPSKALEGRMCHQIRDATVGPFSPSPQSNSQTSAGIAACWLLTVSGSLFGSPDHAATTRVS